MSLYRAVSGIGLLFSFVGIASGASVEMKGTLEGLYYPRERSIGEAERDNARGRFSAAVDYRLGRDTHVDIELSAYKDAEDADFIDGVLELEHDFGPTAVAGGLLREQWGRTDNSRLDILTAQNTVFSLVDPEETVSQPGIRFTGSAGRTKIDVYGLFDRRAQPLPEPGTRFDFGVPAEEVVVTDETDDGALAARVSGATTGLDWAVHGFYGLARQPAYISRFGTAGTPYVEVRYEPISQFGVELETSAGNWRLWTEGFARSDSRDIQGRETDFHYVRAAAEYQAFAAADGAYDLIGSVWVDYDSRGELADRPFQSAAGVGLEVIETDWRPMSVELRMFHDPKLDGYGARLQLDKRLVESPLISTGLQFTTFSGSDRPGLLDVFEQDREWMVYMEWEH